MTHVFPAAPDGELPALQGATVVLPAVTSANLGQLALDVLISSLIGPAPNKGLRLAARLDCDNVLPCVGNDAYAHQQPGTLATALELYHLQGSTTYFLQQRAPAIKGRQAAHAASLCDWLKGQGVAQAVVVCDLDAQARRDAQLDGPPLRFLAHCAAHQELCAGRLGLRALEPAFHAEEQQARGLLPPWPLLAACQERSLPVLLLASFAAADAPSDAMALAHQALELLLLMEGGVGAALSKADVQLRPPCSWGAVFGRALAAAG